MPAISNAVVEGISIKAMPNPDRFGNTFRASLLIGEDWFSYGTTKKEEINVKSGGEWVTLAKGMEVEFMYDVNGDFKNIKKQSFTITNTDNAQASPPKKEAPKNTGGNASKPSQNFVNPAQRGQAMNLAAEVLKYKKADFSNPSKVKEAIVWYLETCADFEALWDTAEKHILAKKTAKKLEAKKEEDKPPFDEDVEMNYDDSDI